MLENGSKLRLSQPELNKNKVQLSKNQKNVKLQGWLKKKSPAILKGWQKRFFMLIENEGCKLVYFEDDKTNSKPKGAFEIQDNILIEQQGEDEFTIKFIGRDLELKAKNDEERKTWIETLEFCKCLSKNLKRKQLSVDEDVSKSKGSTHKKVDLQTTQIVQIEKEKMVNENFQGNKDTQKKSIFQAQQFDDNQILETLGFQQLNQNQMLKSRLVFGCLGKRSKQKMKIYKQRWFILVSAKPLFPEINDDEQVLQQSDINLELDTLIYINQNGNEKQMKRKVYLKLQNCKEIIIKNMQKSSDNGFIFKLNMGDKIYSLMTNSEKDRMKWQKGLNESMKTCREINNNLKIKIQKNINPIIRIYDMEQSLPIRRQKIKEKLELDIQRIELEQNINEQTRFQNQWDLLCCLMLIGQDMIKSIECCIVKDPQRQDIIQEYIDVYHEKICYNISEFWTINNKYLSLNEIQGFATWLFEYQQIILNYIKDVRIRQGITTLLEIYVNRWKQSAERKILVQLEECKTIQIKNRIKTVGAFELFEIIKEIEIVIDEKLNKYFKSKIVMQNIKSVLWQYLEQLYNSVEEQNNNQDFLIGVCNDIETIQEICIRLELIAEQLQENKNQEKIKQKIIGKYQEVLKLVEQEIYNLKQNDDFRQQFQMSLLDLDINKQVLEQFERNVQLMKLIEQSQKSIVERMMSQLQYYYFDSFLNQLDKINNYKRKQIETKIMEDKQIVREFLRKYNLNLQDIFDLIIQLLNSEKEQELIEVFKGLKQYFGRCFTIRTVNVIIEKLRLRKSEVNLKSLSQFDQIIKNMDEEQEYGESTQDVKSQLIEFGQQDTLILQKQDSNSSRTSKTSISKTKVMNIEELITKSQVSIDQSENMSIFEGYVYKKKARQQKLMSKWDYRYVRIRKGYIYWYLEEKSYKCQNKLNIQNVIEVVGKQNKQNKFILRMKDGKEYEFKVDKIEERNMWINGIMNEKRQQDDLQNSRIEAQQVSVNVLNILITNYDQEIIINNNNNLNNKNLNNIQKRKTTLIVGDQNPLELGQTSLKLKKTNSCWRGILVCLGLKKF
ncbi:unnamed protein product [Paramecium sonneborni]|uniref:PH domain-containing protein n=1 Tax=Paramecium sonneborni TaxID=65129 RepID=A0A8S1RGE6_9CILI|nr:unnamed protein product [Paramecium sonneborni]